MGRKAGCRKETNITDVAKKANVSVSTVSRVINNGDIVNPVTRQAIMTAMAELGYKPRSTSKFQVPTMKKTIGIIVVDVRNPFFGELIENVEKAIMMKGYLMTLCTFNNDNDTLELYLREMVERKIDGCIIACAKIPSDSVSLNQLISQLNVVSIQSEIENVDLVDSTDEEGTTEIIEYLIGLGHRKIAFLGYSDSSMFQSRIRGYKTALEKHNIPYNEDYAGFGYPSSKFSYEYTCRLLSMKDAPTAIHCFNEYTASGAYLAIRDHKLRIPDDISLTSFDGTFVSQLCTPALTTVAQPIRSMATIATELLINNITEGPSADKHHITVPTKLVLGQSASVPRIK